MTCPGFETLAAWADGQLTVERHRQLAQHLGQCARCAEQAARVSGLQRSLQRLTLAPESPAFTAALRGKLAGARTRRRSSLLGIAGALAGALLVALALGRTSPPDGLAARGGGSGSRFGFEVRAHLPGRAPLRVREGQRLDARSGYAFVVHNRSHKQQYLMLFAVDAASEVHWFYPAFLDPGSDPESLRIPETPAVRALPEGITPERPAPGAFRIVGLFSPGPLHISEVEARVQAGGLPALARAHPEAELQVLQAELYTGSDAP